MHGFYIVEFVLSCVTILVKCNFKNLLKYFRNTASLPKGLLYFHAFTWLPNLISKMYIIQFFCMLVFQVQKYVLWKPIFGNNSCQINDIRILRDIYIFQAPKHLNFSINLFKAIVPVIIAAPHVLRTVGAITSFFIVSSYSSCRIEGRGGKKQQTNVLMTPRNNGT